MGHLTGVGDDRPRIGPQAVGDARRDGDVGTGVVRDAGERRRDRLTGPTNVPTRATAEGDTLDEEATIQCVADQHVVQRGADDRIGSDQRIRDERPQRGRRRRTEGDRLGEATVHRADGGRVGAAAVLPGNGRRLRSARPGIVGQERLVGQHGVGRDAIGDTQHDGHRDGSVAGGIEGRRGRELVEAPHQVAGRTGDRGRFGRRHSVGVVADKIVIVQAQPTGQGIGHQQVVGRQAALVGDGERVGHQVVGPHGAGHTVQAGDEDVVEIGHIVVPRIHPYPAGGKGRVGHIEDLLPIHEHLQTAALGADLDVIPAVRLIRHAIAGQRRGRIVDHPLQAPVTVLPVPYKAVVGGRAARLGAEDKADRIVTRRADHSRVTVIAPIVLPDKQTPVRTVPGVLIDPIHDAPAGQLFIPTTGVAIVEIIPHQQSLTPSRGDIRLADVHDRLQHIHRRRVRIDVRLAIVSVGHPQVVEQTETILVGGDGLDHGGDDPGDLHRAGKVAQGPHHRAAGVRTGRHGRGIGENGHTGRVVGIIGDRQRRGHVPQADRQRVCDGQLLVDRVPIRKESREREDRQTANRAGLNAGIFVELLQQRGIGRIGHERRRTTGSAGGGDRDDVPVVAGVGKHRTNLGAPDTAGGRDGRRKHPGDRVPNDDGRRTIGADRGGHVPIVGTGHVGDHDVLGDTIPHVGHHDGPGDRLAHVHRLSARGLRKTQVGGAHRQRVGILLRPGAGCRTDGMVVEAYRRRHRLRRPHRAGAGRSGVPHVDGQQELVGRVARSRPAGDLVPLEARGRQVRGHDLRGGQPDSVPTVQVTGRQRDGHHRGIGCRPVIAQAQGHVPRAGLEGRRFDGHPQIGVALQLRRVYGHDLTGTSVITTEREPGAVDRTGRAGTERRVHRAGDQEDQGVRLGINVADGPRNRPLQQVDGRREIQRSGDEVERIRPGIGQHHVVRHVGAPGVPVVRLEPPGDRLTGRGVDRLAPTAAAGGRGGAALFEHHHIRLEGAQRAGVFHVPQMIAARPKGGCLGKGLRGIGRIAGRVDRHVDPDDVQRRQRVEPGVDLGGGIGGLPDQEQIRPRRDRGGREAGRRGDGRVLIILDRHRDRHPRHGQEIAQRLGDVQGVQRHVGRGVLGRKDHVPHIAHRQIGRFAVVRQQIRVGRLERDLGLPLLAGQPQTLQPGGDGDVQRVTADNVGRHRDGPLFIGADLVHQEGDHIIGDRQRAAERDARPIGCVTVHRQADHIVFHHHVGGRQIAVVGNEELPQHLFFPHRVPDGRGKEQQIGGVVDVVQAGRVAIGRITPTLEGDPGPPDGGAATADVNVEFHRAIARRIVRRREGEGDDPPPPADVGIRRHGDGGDGGQVPGGGKVPGREDLGRGCRECHDQVVGQPAELIVAHSDDRPVGPAAIQDTRG